MLAASAPAASAGMGRRLCALNGDVLGRNTPATRAKRGRGYLYRASHAVDKGIDQGVGAGIDQGVGALHGGGAEFARTLAR